MAEVSKMELLITFKDNRTFKLDPADPTALDSLSEEDKELIESYISQLT